jgi:two-component system sensor histidine kinase DesK
MTLGPRDFLAGRLLMVAFLLILLSRDAANLVATPPDPARLAGTALVTVALSLIYGWFWLRVAGSDNDRRALLAVVGLTTLVAVYTALTAATGMSTYYAFYYCAIVAGAAFPWRPGIAAALLTTIAASALVAVEGHSDTGLFDLVIVMLLLGLAAVAVRRHVANFVQLRLAREEIRRLAVDEERLRLARDLHDELGQSLSTVVLQTEALALRIPEAAEPGIRDGAARVAATARSALDSMREVVAGYRSPDLASELAQSCQLLEACGIRCRTVELESSAIAPDTASALAWTVREATTNVLRHSGAKNCWIEIEERDGQWHLLVKDDGRGSASASGGSGLAGLRERIEAAGGRLTTETSPGRGFRVDVHVGATL